MDITLATPLGPVAIRASTEADAAAYCEIRLEALRDYPTAFSSDYAVALARPMSHWAERLRETNLGASSQYLAWHERQTVGLCGIYRGDSPKTLHSANIVGMYVRPPWRGMGIADSLILACLDWARANGVILVKLGLVLPNAQALRCYQRNGFQPYGTEPQAIYVGGVYHDELLMARALPASTQPSG